MEGMYLTNHAIKCQFLKIGTVYIVMRVIYN